MTADTDRVVLITGASRGIGLAAAHGFLADGYRVAAFSRSVPAELDTSALRAKTLLIKGDMTRMEDIDACVAKTLERFGRIDVLVNNAGIQQLGDFATARFDEWARVIAVNVTGLAALTHAVLPGMIRARSGRIVNIVSRSPEVRKAGISAYSASKAAVVSFTRCLAAEFSRPNDPDILINGLIPGITRTAMLAQFGWEPPNAQAPEAIYPFIKQLAELPPKGPNGQVFWEGSVYAMYQGFAEQDDPEIDPSRVTATR